MKILDIEESLDKIFHPKRWNDVILKEILLELLKRIDHLEKVVYKNRPKELDNV